MIDLVTPEEVKREAAKGLKEAIAVSIKKFDKMLLLTVKDFPEIETFGAHYTCGLCRYKLIRQTACRDCVLCKAGEDCREQGQYANWVRAVERIRNETETTIFQFRKETRKMIKILKQLYKECK